MRTEKLINIMYLRELKEQIEELMLERLEEAISVNLKMLKKI